jgi:GAF domain-containing protein
LENLQEELHYPLFWLGKYDRIQHQIASQGHLSPVNHRLLTSTFALSSGDLLEQVVIQQRPLIVNDLRIESRMDKWTDLAEQGNIQGALLFPVRRRDVCYSVLMMGTTQWGQPISAGDRTFISTICSALADVLHKQEQVAHIQKQKDPGIAITSLIQQLQGVSDRESQLATLTQAIMQFIEADRVRIFWLNPTQFEFWERLSINSKKSRKPKHFSEDKASIRISATELRGVYQSLNHQQLLVVGEAQSAINATVPNKFMKLLGAEACLVAPLFEQQTLLGFICVENKQPRVWAETHRTYLSTVAQLAGLMMPYQAIAEHQSQAETNLRLLTGIVQSIQSETDWYKTLEFCGEALFQNLGVQQFWVLALDPEHRGYNAVFRKLEGPRKKLSLNWPGLDEVDWQLLERSASAIAIHDLTQELKLLTWRENFLALEARSLLACNVTPGNAPEAIVLVSDTTPRYWTEANGTLLQKVAQQIGLILRQWQLQRQTEQHGSLYDSIQWGMKSLQQTYDLEALEAFACRHLADFLDAALVVLISWSVNAEYAYPSQVISRAKDFGATPDAEIPIGFDAVINWALQTNGPLPVTWEDFPQETQEWLQAPPGSRFLLVALRTADAHAFNAVWIVATHSDRKWTEHHLSLLSLLANQLAWSRRHLNVVNVLLSRRESLEALNWYKHKRLDEIHRQLGQVRRQLDPILTDKAVSEQRQLQALRQLDSLLTNMQEMLANEDWQIQSNHQTTPLISLLNRLMDRANPLIQTRQLWAKVHNDSNVIITGDIEKIEYVLYELVVAACERSPDQGQLDIWCRPLDRAWLELSITDDGDVPLELLKELDHGRPDDILVPSLLDVLPGLHFNICQALMQQIGGEFSLQKLEDGRTISRVVLAIAGKGRSIPHRQIDSEEQ